MSDESGFRPLDFSVRLHKTKTPRCTIAKNTIWRATCLDRFSLLNHH